MEHFKIILFLTICLISCGDDDPIDFEGPFTGVATVNKNDVQQIMNLEIVENNGIPSRYDIVLRRDIDNDNSEGLVMRKIKANFENQTVLLRTFNNAIDMPEASYLTTFQDDILNDVYDIDTTATNNFIQITSFNDLSNEITGIFNLKFILTEDASVGDPPPETLVFSNGTFTTQVNPAWFH